MAPTEYPDRQELFSRAFRDFVNAHVRGMRSLKEGDLRGLQEAVAVECVAVQKVSILLKDALSFQEPGSAFEPRRAGGSDMSLGEEHMRLLDQTEALEREHRHLEIRSYDLAEHRKHRGRLHAHICDLRVHAQRLQGEDQSS